MFEQEFGNMTTIVWFDDRWKADCVESDIKGRSDHE